jgi:hypothetical protein
MASSAPRTDGRLVAAIERLDDPAVRIAETNRKVGLVAEALGLARPSYEQVRRIVHAARRRGRHPTTGEVLLDIAFHVRPPAALGEHFAGVLPPEPRRRR